MTRLAAPTPTAAVRLDLRFDDLATLVEHLPGAVLPDFGVPHERSPQETITRLTALGILDGTDVDGDDWSDATDPTLRMALATHGVARVVVRSHQWTPDTVIDRSLGMVAGDVAGILVRADADGSASASVVAGPDRDAWSLLASDLPELDAGLAAGETATVDLATSRALVRLVGEGRTAAADALAASTGQPHARALFGEFARPASTGLEVEVFAATGGMWAGRWYGARHGWVRLAIGHDGPLTAEALTQEATITASRVSTSDIRADLLTVITRSVLAARGVS